MKNLSVLVVYATREGQTRRIADYIAVALRERGHHVHLHDAADGDTIDLSAHGAFVLAASIHLGKHEREMVEFVRAHRAQLEAAPTMLLSVSLAQAGAEDVTSTFEKRERAAAEVKKTIDVFVKETGFHPAIIHPVAGALLYRQYNFVVRLVMRMMAKRGGAPTDTSRDYVFTDWRALESFADEFATGARA